MSTAENLARRFQAPTWRTKRVSAFEDLIRPFAALADSGHNAPSRLPCLINGRTASCSASVRMPCCVPLYFLQPDRKLASLSSSISHQNFQRNACTVLLRRRCKLRTSQIRRAGGLNIVITSLRQLQGGAEGIGAFLEDAPPACYLIYLLAAGFGLPCSEDALVAWVGSNISKGMYGSTQSNALVMGIVYLGVVVSDMITFSIGVLLKFGFFKGLKRSLFRNSDGLEKASTMIQRWSRLIGFIQRFSLGFRGPLCLVCGFTDVSATQFALGVAIGALGTIPVQLFAGYMLRDTPSPYFAALAIAAGPNLVGHVAGPIITALGLFWTSKTPDTPGGQAGTQAS